MSFDPLQPLDTGLAKKWIRQIIERGVVVHSNHALEQMEEDELTMVDCTNVLRGGQVQYPELKDGTWRYRVLTSRICVVVAFRSEEELRIVTAWRIRNSFQR